MSAGSTVTTHVLDTVRGRPAVGLAVTLADAGGAELGRGTTDDDGRVGSLGPADLAPGAYVLTFATGDWFAAQDRETFLNRVVLEVALGASDVHLHVPVLLSPFACSTYRGS